MRSGKLSTLRDGKPLRLSGLHLDITERMRAEEAVRQAEALERRKRDEQETLLDVLPAPVLIARNAGCVDSQATRQPISYLELPLGTNLSKSAPAGKAPTNFELFQNGRPLAAADLPLRKAAAKRSFVEEELEIRFADGRSKHLLGNALPILDDAGEVRGAVAAYTDITALKRTEEALRESEERLKFALDAARAGTWEVSLETGELTASDRTLSFHGIPAGTPMTHESVLARVHPDDRPRVDEALRHTLETGEPFRMECRNLIADGSVRWMEARGERRSVAGKQVIGGLVLDITDRKRTEAALRESEERLRFSLKGANAAAWQWEWGAEKQVWSPESYVLHGRDPSLGPPTYGEWLQCLHPDDRAKVENVISRLVGMRWPAYRTDYRILRPSGEVRWLDALGRIDYAADGAPLRISGINLDITERKRAEEARLKAEELERQKREELETILAAIPAAVLIAKDASCNEITGNPAAYSLLCCPPGSNLSKTAPDKQAPRNYDIYENGLPAPIANFAIRKAVAEKRAVSGQELEFRFAEGSAFVLGNALPLLNDAGEVRGAVAAYADITDLKRTEAALRESEERLQFALKAAGAGTWEVALDTGKFIASDRTVSLHALPSGTVMTHERALACKHPEDRPRIEAAFRHTVETGEPFRLETRVPLPDGSMRWIESTGELRSVSGRRMIGGLALDITDRKRAETALRESEELLRAIIEHVPVPIMLSTEDRKVLLINPALTELTGYTVSDIPTRDVWEALAYREEAPRVKDDVRRAFEGGVPVDLGDHWVYTKSGDKRLWSVRRAPAGRDALGRRLLVGVALDITEHKKSEEDASAARSKLEAALSAMSDAVLISDAEGGFNHLNEAFAEFHKFKSKDETAGSLAEYPELFDLFLPNGELVPLEQWPIYRALRGESATGAEYLLHRKDTGALWMGSYNFAPIRSNDGDMTGAVLTARDITEQRANERRLRASEARLSSIIDTAPDSIIVLDEKGIIQSVNRATANIFGYSPEELIGQHVNFLMPQEFRKQHRGYLKAFAGAARIEEMEAQRKDGTLVPLDLGLAEWRDDEGPRFFTAIFRDISERKRNEEALANARRLEATGQLAGGVAHDFNNLLSVIAGNLELAEDHIADKTTRDLIRRALDAAEQGSGLNRRLLSLARKRTLKPQRLTLNSRVEETAKLLTSTLGEHIAVTADLAPGLWMTLADPGEIDSAILNIAANARDAMPGGGSIRITTLNVALDARAAAKLHGEAKAGDYVRLAIADDGAGMPQEVLDKAMEPFFTTKEPSAGTGLGLTSVSSFARQTGGFATIASASSCGCVVSLYLPRAPEDQPALKAVEPSPLPFGDGELVLVVEDDPRVREVTLKRVNPLVMRSRKREPARRRSSFSSPARR